MKAPKMRRSVSFAAITYVRMWLHCHREGLAMSAWLDEVTNAELDLHDAATPTMAEARAAIQSIREAKKLKTQAAKLRRVLFGIARSSVAKLTTSDPIYHSGNGHYL